MRKLRFGAEGQESNSHALTLGFHFFPALIYPYTEPIPRLPGSTRQLKINLFLMLSGTFHEAHWFVQCLLPMWFCSLPLSCGSFYFRSEKISTGLEVGPCIHVYMVDHPCWFSATPCDHRCFILCDMAVLIEYLAQTDWMGGTGSERGNMQSHQLYKVQRGPVCPPLVAEVVSPRVQSSCASQSSRACLGLALESGFKNYREPKGLWLMPFPIVIKNGLETWLSI